MLSIKELGQLFTYEPETDQTDAQAELISNPLVHVQVCAGHTYGGNTVWVVQSMNKPLTMITEHGQYGKERQALEAAVALGLTL